MKKYIGILVLAFALVVAMLVRSAHASGPFTVNGGWGGTAFATAPIDMNSDGVFARTFKLTANGQLRFVTVEGAFDTGLVGFGCAGPNSLLLQPFGVLTFRALDSNNAVFVTVDSTQNICFDPVAPNETVALIVNGGTGIYAGVTGSGSATLNDVVRYDQPAGPNFPPGVRAPIVIDTRATFSLTIQ
jgi:hypothetical protein